MEWIELIQTILLIILVDRTLILRNRYKFAISNRRPIPGSKGYWDFWIYCKSTQGDKYMKSGGKRLFGFSYGKVK